MNPNYIFKRLLDGFCVFAGMTAVAVRWSAWLGALLLGLFVASGLVFYFCCLLGYFNALGERWGRALLGL